MSALNLEYLRFVRRCEVGIEDGLRKVVEIGGTVDNSQYGEAKRDLVFC